MSIDGWEIRYYEPTYGWVSWTVRNWAEREKAETRLNEIGVHYTVKELR